LDSGGKCAAQRRGSAGALSDRRSGRRWRSGRNVRTRRPDGTEELVETDLVVTVLVEVGEDALGMALSDAGDAFEFFQSQEAVAVFVEFIEAAAALFENAGADRFHHVGLFLIGENAVAVGVPGIAAGFIGAVRTGRRARHFAGTDSGDEGLALLFGEPAILVRVERYEDSREAAVTERIAFTGVDRRGRDQEDGTE
jgi:hypothetical protein